MKDRVANRAPSRRVLSREWAYGNCYEVRLSCGHTLYIRALGRYGHTKTLGCATCQREKEVPA
jgi:hypothetical protein